MSMLETPLVCGRSVFFDDAVTECVIQESQQENGSNTELFDTSRNESLK